MDYLHTYAISAAGMRVERLRVETASVNLAHANTVADAGGAGYTPLHVVVRAGVAPGRGFDRLVRGGLAVPVASVHATGQPSRSVLDPGHPLADATGHIRQPGIDVAREMLTLLGATRAYEANVAALHTARALALRALEIGRAP